MLGITFHIAIVVALTLLAIDSHATIEVALYSGEVISEITDALLIS